MTPSRSRGNAHELYDELAAGYALGALEPEDEGTFVAHLATCDECIATTAAFSNVAAELVAVSDDIPAPPGVWSGIQRQIAGDAATPAVTRVADRRAKPIRRLAHRFPGRFPAIAAVAASIAVVVVASAAAINVFSDSP